MNADTLREKTAPFGYDHLRVGVSWDTPSAVKDWLYSARQLDEITPDTLRGAPAGVIPMLRMQLQLACGRPFAVNMEGASFHNDAAQSVIEHVRLDEVVSLDSEASYDGVIQYVISMKRGTQVVVSPGIAGINWRIMADHSLADTFPQLTRVITDEGRPPGLLTSKTLAQATTERGFDARDIAEGLANVINSVVRSSGLSRATGKLEGTDYLLTEPNISIAEAVNTPQEEMIALALGLNYGLRSVLFSRGKASDFRGVEPALRSLRTWRPASA